MQRKLAEMRERAWSPFVYLGSHLCDIRVGAGNYREDFVASRSRDALPLGTRNLFVPGDGVVYVAPELVIHYVDAHGYAPPKEFRDAVEVCPPMGSDEYFRALRRSGGFAIRSPDKHSRYDCEGDLS